jgi:hypothetical protein
MDHTTAIGGKGLEKAAAAPAHAGMLRSVLGSVFPEARRDRDTTEYFEHYMKIKNTAAHLPAPTAYRRSAGRMKLSARVTVAHRCPSHI